MSAEAPYKDLPESPKLNRTKKILGTIQAITILTIAHIEDNPDLVSSMIKENALYIVDILKRTPRKLLHITEDTLSKFDHEYEEGSDDYRSF